MLHFQIQLSLEYYIQIKKKKITSVILSLQQFLSGFSIAYWHSGMITVWTRKKTSACLILSFYVSLFNVYATFITIIVRLHFHHLRTVR